MNRKTVFLLSILLSFAIVGCTPRGGDKLEQDGLQGEKIDRNKISLINFTELKGEEIPQRIQGWLENNKEFEQAMLVDDEGEFFVVITRGQKSTGGYDVSIDGINLTLVDGRSTLQVDIRYVDPHPDAMVTQALTYPYVIARVDLNQQPEEIKYEIETVTGE